MHKNQNPNVHKDIGGDDFNKECVEITKIGFLVSFYF